MVRATYVFKVESFWLIVLISHFL